MSSLTGFIDIDIDELAPFGLCGIEPHVSDCRKKSRRFRPRGALIDPYVAENIGRSGELRTLDPLLPKQVLLTSESPIATLQAANQDGCEPPQPTYKANGWQAAVERRKQTEPQIGIAVFVQKSRLHKNPIQ
jgi:hypothetical protein